MKEKEFKSPESYIATIGPIGEGNRNNTLHQIGIQLRKIFGLVGEILLRYLRAINTEKCNPPLEDGEVETIARSVDRSNAPLGKNTVLLPVDEYLQKQVSLFDGVTDKFPSDTLTIGQFLDACKNGKYQKPVERIRNEEDEKRQDAMKKELLAVTIQSKECSQREAKFCQNDAVICLDFDDIDDVEKAKQAIADVPYVFAVSVSSRGRGVFALAALANPTEDLKPILEVMQTDFNYIIDKKCSDVSRLRFVTYDSDLIVKDCVIPFQPQDEKVVPDNAQNTNKPIEGEYCPSLGAFVLNPSRPLPSAEAFLRDKYSIPEGFTLWHYAGEFHCWTGNHYRLVSTRAIKIELLCWLNKAVVLQRNNNPIPFPAKKSTANDVFEALEGLCQLDENEGIKSGAWLGDKGCMPPVSSPIFAQNCVYDWETDKEYPCSPLWFNLSCLNTVIDVNAPKPERWHQFLNELWGDDKKSKRLLHEFMGLCLTLDTSFQKMLLIVGPKRSGKGTIFRIMTAILGVENVAAPNTGTLAAQFGLHPLIGKPLATISDARFAGRGIQVAVERLLNISGEDAVMIDRKYRDATSVKLPTRIMVASNEMPMLPDSAGALANRFLVLRMTKSFFDSEDRGLADALEREMPGILKLMIHSLRRLYNQGFTQTAYQVEFIRELEELGNPIRSFVEECCVLSDDKSVTTTMLWEHWEKWCNKNGQRCGEQAIFGRNLKTCFPEITKKRRGKYCYFGIGLRPLGLNPTKTEVTDDEDATQ